MKAKYFAHSRMALSSLLLLAMSPRAFPCSPPRQRMLDFVSSPWSTRYDGQVLKVGPQPVFLARSADDLPEVLTVDGADIAMDYAVLRTPELQHDGLLAFIPRAPLAPGRYCTQATCVDVEAAFDNSPVTVTTTIRGADRSESGGGCMGSGDCGGWTLPRAVEVTTQTAPGEGVRLATWRIVLRDVSGQLSYPLATLFGRGTYSDPDQDVLAIADGQVPVELERFKQLCVTLQPVLWDGTVLQPVDGGCVTFERTLEE